VAGEGAYKTRIEGDKLTYAILDDKLWQVPLAGGTPVLAADGQTTGFRRRARRNEPLLGSRAQIGGPAWSIWRHPRDGGAAFQLAIPPVPTPTYAWQTLSAVPGGVLVTAEGKPVAAYLVPRDGSPSRRLPRRPKTARHFYLLVPIPRACSG
jgi:hypothetical protein